MPIKDITDERFGRLVAISYRRKGRKTLWLCRCDCGAKKEVVLGHLTQGKARSCGCLRAEKNVARTRTHGMSRSPEYQAYRNALYRCTREADVRFASYGGRGIKFCFASFQEFIGHIGPRPSPQHSLDRIDSDGNYEIGNVRWATAEKQSRNKTSNRMVAVNGEQRPLVEWAEIYGVPYKKAFERIFYGGWSPERALEIEGTVVHVEAI